MVAMTTRAAAEDLGALLRRSRGRRQLTRGATCGAGRPLGGGDQQTGAGRPAQPQGADPLSYTLTNCARTRWLT